MTRPIGVVVAVLLFFPFIETWAQEPFNQEQAIAQLKAKIVGQEQKPAEEVFKNVQMFKGRPAAQLVRTMETGFPRALGVQCTHCHVPGEWDKDEKVPKQVTREMMAMTAKINTELLSNIKGIKSEKPTVGCTTCHRGQVKPSNALVVVPPKP
jgi:photosynthetic reaction center cytochrome c subunit